MHSFDRYTIAETTRYCGPFLISAILIFIIFLYTCKRLHTPSAWYLALLCFAASVWAASEGMLYADLGIETKIWLTKLQYFGIAPVPPLALLFTLSVFSSQSRATGIGRFLLFLLMAAIILTVWTNPLHHLYFTGYYIIPTGPSPMLGLRHGPIWWVTIAYHYFIVAVLSVILLKKSIFASGFQRSQARLMLVAVMSVWVANAVYVTGKSPIANMDISPIAFTLVAASMAWGFFRYNLLDILPFAKAEIFRGLDDAILVFDGSNRLIDINPAAASIFKIEMSKNFGQEASLVFPSHPEFLNIIEKMKPAEIQLIHDGREFTYDVRVSFLTEREGNRLGQVISLRDISERKRAEASLIQVKERFKTFFSSVNDAIFVHPLQKEGFAPFIEVNDIACRRYGYTRDELLSLSPVDITKKEDVEVHAESSHRKKLLETRHMVFEAVHIKKSGEEFPVEINSNIVEQYGQAVIIAVVRDISERKKASEEKRRIEAQYRQAQKMEAIGRLAGGVAHDLNNILSPIIGYSELLVHDFRPEDKRLESLNHIVQAGYRARDIVGQLLAFARKQTLEYKITNLNTAIGEFEGFLRRTIRENIEIEIVLSPKIWNIRADIGQIEQVIINLAVNAQDAMPEGGRLTIETDMADLEDNFLSNNIGIPKGRYILLTVRDTGCGMDEEIREHIYDPFFSTKGDQGTGLGLATVYGIVKQHGGGLRVDSNPDSGAAFTVYLPAIEEKIDEKSRKTPPRQPNGTGTILLVEDSDPVRKLSYAILKKFGYDVIVAHNGTEAMESLRSVDGAVDLLLTDVIMPDMSGKDLYLNASKKFPGIRVLYMSGYTDDVIAHHGVLEQGVQFIQKPFSVNDLAIKVKEVLDNSEGKCPQGKNL